MPVPLIAVVEYEPAIRLLMDEILTDLGYEPRLWSQDQCPWVFIHHEQPDLVILDLWLQRRGDGWALLNRLWQHPTTSQIPVIVCSADRQMLQEQEAMLRLRGCDTLEKPFQVDELHAMIARRVGPTRQSRRAVCSPDARAATG